MWKKVLGPPGTGKTTHLLGEVEKCLESGVPPSKIAYLAFTKKAATEAIERAEIKFGLTEKMLPYFRTLHSLTFRLLGLNKRQVMAVSDYRVFGNVMGVDISGYGGGPEGMVVGVKPGDMALFLIAKARMRKVPLEQQWREQKEDLGWFELERLARGLEEFKKQRELMDFTDMLEQFVEIGQGPELELLVIDEAQDLSSLQWAVVQKLAKTANHVILAGDDDQAIFQWAGADVDQFIDMKADEQVLSQSYRIPSKVQDTANAIAARISHRIEKAWKPRPEEGEVNYESRGINVDMSAGSWLVLVRNGYLLKSMEEQCMREGWIYEKAGRHSVAPASLRAIRAWERLRNDELTTAADVQAILRMVPSKNQNPPREGMFSMGDLQRNWGVNTTAIWHEAFDKMSLVERSYLVAALRRGESVSKTPRIRLNTIHSTKGGEADNVLLYSDVSPQSYKNMQTHPDEEARVFYVATTRAKNKLHIVLPQTRFSFALGV
jgi:DNA helicase II / ATP-dependent DNA helicase PcrA